MKIKLEEKRTSFGGGWSRWVEVNGERFCVSLTQGKRVRIPYMPTGKNIGYQWWGIVRNVQARAVWSDRVNKSTGARRMIAEMLAKREREEAEKQAFRARLDALAEARKKDEQK